jgi:hypothetical protein
MALLWCELELQNGLAVDGSFQADTQNIPPCVIRVIPMNCGESGSDCVRGHKMAAFGDILLERPVMSVKAMSCLLVGDIVSKAIATARLAGRAPGRIGQTDAWPTGD